ncbi:Uncharacterized protein dnl_56000 [Desulfonema limicola]|uniref:Uncharacterized protein n=1 Tax=Desulfonema limicola TaxID=45656 RepID=A0A975GJ70_9BACT|nr:Uncharacterized protein dnl_56000 [Desulfonema limicola]
MIYFLKLDYLTRFFLVFSPDIKKNKSGNKSQNDNNILILLSFNKIIQLV